MDSRTLCLGALMLGDASGYEIKKLYEEGAFSHFYETSFGSIYPALTRLVQDGYANCTELAQDKRPDKKVYSITARGREAFAEALKLRPAPDEVRSDFCFIMVFGRLLPPALVMRMIESQIAFYRENLARMEGCEHAEDSPTGQLIHGLGLAIYRAAAEHLERHKDAVLAQMTAPAAPRAAE